MIQIPPFDAHQDRPECELNFAARVLYNGLKKERSLNGEESAFVAAFEKQQTFAREELLRLLDQRNRRSMKTWSQETPLPHRYVLENWRTGNAEADKANWIESGDFWKFSDAVQLNKDNAYEDFDTFECFHRLVSPRLLWIDHALVRQQFASIQHASDQDVENFVLNRCSYISKGQIERLKQDWDNFKGLTTIDAFVHENERVVGVRQRGGGRAATLFGGECNEDGSYEGFDVKGCGTSELQKEFPANATGLLCLGDALKEVTMERLIRERVLKDSPHYGTVKHFAIIDVGLQYGDNVINPATGWTGDRCVLLVREAVARLSGSYDEPVYYGVAQLHQLKQHQALLALLLEKGISSQQVRDADNSWNIQVSIKNCKSIFYFQNKTKRWMLLSKN